MIDWFKSYKEKQYNSLGDSNFLQQKKYCFETGVNWKKARNYAKSASSVDKNFYAITQDLRLDKSGAMS